MGTPHEEYILNATEYAFSNVSSGGAAEKLPETLPISVGTEYTVEWDGTPYYLTAVAVGDVEGVVGIGNAALIDIGADTGEPFFVVTIPKQFTQIVTSVAAKHTVAILAKVRPVIPIDSKFLPQSVFDYDALNNKPVTAELLDITMSKQLSSYNLMAGSNYIEGVNEELEVAEGAFYRISGTISLTYLNNLTMAELVMDGLYPSVNGKGYIQINEVGEYLGDALGHKPWSFRVSRLYSKSHPFYTGALCISYDISGTGTGASFNIEINLKVEKMIMQLDQDCIPAEIARKTDIPDVPSATSSDYGKALVVGTDGTLEWSSDIIVPSSTPNSSKYFAITVDDTGEIKATEVTI